MNLISEKGLARLLEILIKYFKVEIGHNLIISALVLTPKLYKEASLG
jgi:hypothetical protein